MERINKSSVTDARGNLLSIQWQDQSEDFRQWLAARADIELRHLAPGQEADTWVLARGDKPEYVLKVWNKSLRADAKEQHRFLSHARQAGLPVPRSVGWGRDEGGHQILATRFAGYPLDRPTDEQIRRCARLLAQVHEGLLRQGGSCLPRPASTSRMTGRYLSRPA